MEFRVSTDLNKKGIYKIKMVKNTDLHTHSHYSDGQISPRGLVRLAKRRGIKNLALTDHNLVKGVNEAIEEGSKVGVNIIPAVEIRCDKGEVLGYFIDIENKELITVLRGSSRRVEGAVKDRCQKLGRKGYNISFKEIQKRFPKARGNINEFYPLYLLHLKGYGRMLELSKKFRRDKNLKPKKIKELTIFQAIRLIKNAGGVPVLAHPWIEGEVLMDKNFRRYVKAGLKGIEINNGDRYPFKKKGTDRKIRNLAKKYSLIITSGSDYHGVVPLKQMPGNHNLGKNNCDERIVDELRKLSRNH